LTCTPAESAYVLSGAISFPNPSASFYQNQSHQIPLFFLSLRTCPSFCSFFTDNPSFPEVCRYNAAPSLSPFNVSPKLLQIFMGENLKQKSLTTNILLTNVGSKAIFIIYFRVSLKTLYFAPPDHSGFAFIVLFRYRCLFIA